jgi:Predicted permease.
MYIVAIGLLILSLIKDRQKSLLALKKAWNSFENILPLFFSLLLIIGMMLAILSPQVISGILGKQSGILGLFLAAAIGSCTIIPGFITFPLASSLLKNGAGMTQVILLISTSVMVSLITIPLESKYFGKKATYIRNSLSLVFSFIIAFAMGNLIW